MIASRQESTKIIKQPLPIDITDVSMGSNTNPIGDWNRLAPHITIDGKTVASLANPDSSKQQCFDEKSNEAIEPFLTSHLLAKLDKKKLTPEIKTWLTRSMHQTSLLGFISFPLMSALTAKGYNPITEGSELKHHIATNTTGFEIEEHYVLNRVIKRANTKFYEAEAPHHAVLEAKATLVVDFSEFTTMKTGPKISAKEGGYIIYGHKKMQKLLDPEYHEKSHGFFFKTAKKIQIALKFAKNPAEDKPSNKR